jgi:3-dehydroquinate dehydratase
LICGFGAKGYELAIEAMADLVAKPTGNVTTAKR